jgi:hypothetical protein
MVPAHACVTAVTTMAPNAVRAVTVIINWHCGLPVGFLIVTDCSEQPSSVVVRKMKMAVNVSVLLRWRRSNEFVRVIGPALLH